MSTRILGQPIRRNEDPRLLRGKGAFVADLGPPGTLHAAVLRSPHAHARLRGIDVSRARALEGVTAVWTAADLGEYNQPGPLLIPHPALEHPRTQLTLARETVHYQGEAVAFVVARDRYLAEDALELIEVDYEPLPAVVDVERAMAPGAPLVHDGVERNVAAHLVQQVGDVEAAFRRADLVLGERLTIERSCAQPMECRGVLAAWDERAGALTCWISTQAPLTLANGLARLFGLPEHKVRVIAPDVGGGFGVKIMLFYPEEILCPLAAIRLGRPVKFVEDRREHFLSANHERGQVHDIQIAVRSDGTILGLRDHFLHDQGAYTPYGIVVPLITAAQLPGPYRVPSYEVGFTVVYTNKTPVSPYRGAGRPHACFAMERAIGLIARALDLAPAEVRRRNFIQPHEFPWDVGLTFQDGAPTRYDSGDYPATLERCLALVGSADFPAEQARARQQGRFLGLGLGCYVEGTGIGPYEGAHVRVEPSGRVFVATGLTTQGQGHFTTFAQLAAHELGVDPRDVTVVTGDSAAFTWGAGTFASRGLVTAGNAIALAARRVADKARRLAAELLEVSPKDLELADGQVRVRGAAERALPLGAVAVVANPIRYSYGKEAMDAALRLVKPRSGAVLAEGEEPGLEARAFFAPERATWANGAHAAVVEVELETGQVRFLRYAVVHDCGTVVNPAIVESQVHGGTAQGIGGALYERLVYDASGQLLSASFMDFLIPTAQEVPPVQVAHQETPSLLNPLGIKGLGESGAIPVPALVAEALDDALSPLGVRIVEMPLSPARVLELVRGAARHRGGGYEQG